ncbi:hypothetical protein LPJ60_004912 [Coemansia sp. RSA 2675]|nr:hypothetical protein LPJ60_004912 [Coemansia sp. RSA 2675]
MKLEEKLARWAEQPEDIDDDDDYGLIIDDSVTAPAARPKFTKAGSCSQLPSTTAPALGLLAANLAPVAGRRGLSSYEESAETENYDDLVLPEEADQLDRQLSAWKTPCRRLSWASQLAAEVTMSGATAVEGDDGRRKGEAGTPTLGMGQWGGAAAGSPPASAPAPGHAGGVLSPARPRAPSGLGLAAGGSGNGRQRVPSAKQRHQNHKHNPNYSYGRAGSSPQMAQAQAQPRRPVLIRNAPRAAEPIVVGCMRYDPVGRIWLGNEEEGARIASAIAESERQLRLRGLRSGAPIDAGKLARKISQRSGNPSLVPALLLPDDMLAGAPSPGAPPSPTLWRCSPVAAPSPASPPIERGMQGRPALISPSAVLGVGSSGASGRARPIFDPQNLRWIDPNESQRDAEANPFWNIAALPLEPPSVDAIRQKSRHRSATECIGLGADRSCFVLSEEQIEAYRRESAEYESFARRWFPSEPAN